MKPKGQDPRKKDIIKDLWVKNLRSVGLLGANTFGASTPLDDSFVAL